MRVTFMNQLALGETGKENSIRYKHPFRVNVDIFIRQRAHEGQNWELLFASQGAGSVPGSIRKALEREFRLYIRQRIKRSLGTLSYDDFVEMANAVSVS